MGRLAARGANGLGGSLFDAANSAALGAILNGPECMLTAVTPGQMFVGISTVSPAFSREIANKIREKGGDMTPAGRN